MAVTGASRGERRSLNCGGVIKLGYSLGLPRCSTEEYLRVLNEKSDFDVLGSMVDSGRIFHQYAVAL